MYVTLYETARQNNRTVLRLLMLTNIVFAALVLGAWTVASVFISDPISWATWRNINGARTWEELFQYPYLMLWALPLGAVLASWIAVQAKKWKLACGLALTPVVFLGLTIALYYVIPGAHA
jgi:hypothetical protein